MKNAILFGSTSEIGSAIIEEYCNPLEWMIIRAGSQTDTVNVKNRIDLLIDWDELGTIETTLDPRLANVKFDFVVVSLGYLPDTKLQFSSEEILESANANLLWPLLCIEFLQRNDLFHKDTIIVLVSSSLVALPATKKSLTYTIFKSTLEEILVNAVRYNFIACNVIFLRPGYVSTKINSHLAPGKFPTTARIVAMTLSHKIRKGKVTGIVYAPTQIGALACLTRILPTRVRRLFLDKVQNTN
jgi:hypothetical protein